MRFIPAFVMLLSLIGLFCTIVAFGIGLLPLAATVGYGFALVLIGFVATLDL